jgi:tetratricopeptide (TPR) repeat protein
MKRIIIFSAFVSLLIFADEVFGQCGADGTQPCPTPSKEVAKKTPSKSNSKSAVKSKPVSEPKPKAKLPAEIKLNPKLREAKVYYDKAWSDCPQAYSDTDKNAINCKINFMTIAIEIYPDYADAFDMRAYWNKKLEKFDEAAGDYARVIELQPKKYEPYFFRAEIARTRAEKPVDSSQKKVFYDQALSDYSKVIELEPTSYDSLRYRGNIYVGRQEFDKAIDDLNKSIILMNKAGVPYPENFYYDRGLAFVRRAEKQKLQNGANEETKRDYESAIQDFSKAISLQAGKATFYSMRGYAYFQQNNFDAAVKDLTVAIEKRQSSPDKFNFYWRSKSYEKLGKKDLAVADWTKYETIK